MEGQLIRIGNEDPAAQGDKLSVATANANGPPASAATSDYWRHETEVIGGRRDATGESSMNSNGGSSMPSTKRDRFKRHASMDEDRGMRESAACETDLKETEETADDGASSRGANYNYGIKSFLDQFYDVSGSFKDPELYEDDPDLLLLANPRHRTSRCGRWCRAYWWKMMAVIGLACLVAGIVATGIGFLSRRRQLHSELPSPPDATVADELTLDMCRLVGLVLFCVGGIMLAVALLVPSFPASRQCCIEIDDDDWQTSYCTLYDDIETPSAMSRTVQSIKAAVPATKKLAGIQPATVTGQTRLVTDSVIPY